MEPLVVEVGDLLTEHGASLEVRRPVALGPLKMGEVVYTPEGPATLDVTLSHAGEGVVAHGTVDVDLATECSRCLQPFVFHVQGDVQGLYVASMDSAWADEEDAEPITHGDVDLSAAVESAIRVEIPFAPVHSPDCQGICPTCGADLNAGACGCDTGAAVPGPFDALKDLLDTSSAEDEKGND